MGQLTSFGRFDGRNLFFLPIKWLGDFPEAVNLPDAHFGLLLACDARDMADATILSFAKSALKQGMAYLCAYGPDCKRVHDLADKEKWDSGLDHNDETTIMTTWHDDETLDEVLWFFLNCASGAGKYECTCKSFLAISVNNDEWGKTIRTRLNDPVALSRNVVGPDTGP